MYEIILGRGNRNVQSGGVHFTKNVEKVKIRANYSREWHNMLQEFLKFAWAG
jgi:hypothetical protein